MKAFGLFFLLAIARFSFAAEQPFNSTNLGEVPEDDGLFLGHHVSIWENTGKPVNEDAIFQGQKADAFLPSQTDFPGPKFIYGEMWLKLTLTNSGNQPIAIVVESRYPSTDFLSFFEKTASGMIRAQHQGDQNLQVDHNGHFRSPAFTTNLMPGTHDFFLRTSSNGPNLLSLYLWRATAFEKHKFADTVLLGCLFGFLLALLLYNGFLAFSFRSRTYQFYTVFLLLMIVLQMSMQNMWPHLLNRRLAAWLANEGYVVLAMLTNVIGLSLTMLFLNMKTNLPRTRRVFYGLMILSLVPAASMFVAPFQTVTQLVSLNIGLSAVGMIGASLMTIVQGYRPAAYYLIASLSLLAVNILITLNVTGIYHSPDVIQFGNFFGIVMEGLQMSFAIADRVRFFRKKSEQKILNLNQELQNHLTQVEAVVSERTNTIRTILDNVASGLIIVDRTGRIGEGYSQICRHLLDHDLVVGQNFSEILQLSKTNRKLWDLAWTQIFQETLPLEVSLAQLPQDIVQSRRSLKLEAKALFDEHGSVKSILLTIQDVSALKKKQIESFRNRRLIKILGDIEAFRQFINHSFEILAKLRVSADKREQSFLLHTLKGNSLVFDLKAIANHLHRLEDAPLLLPEHIEPIGQMFQKFLMDHESILKTPWGLSIAESRITRLHITQLETIIGQTQDQKLKREVNDWAQELMQRSVQTLIKPMLSSCRSMAKKLRKSVTFELIGGEIRLQSKQEEFLIEILIHIIRNALVHGIEDNRVGRGKPMDSVIQIEFKVEGQNLMVVCADDGQGFDRQRWEARARSSLNLSEEDIQKLSWTELIRQVSRGGYSTQNTVTLIAGRGVGLEGIFQSIDELGGRIHLTSEAGRGSRIQIELPRVPQELARAS